MSKEEAFIVDTPEGQFLCPHWRAARMTYEARRGTLITIVNKLERPARFGEYRWRQLPTDRWGEWKYPG